MTSTFWNVGLTGLFYICEKGKMAFLLLFLCNLLGLTHWTSGLTSYRFLFWFNGLLIILVVEQNRHDTYFIIKHNKHYILNNWQGIQHKTSSDLKVCILLGVSIENYQFRDNESEI